MHRFNEIGLGALDPRWAGGRPRLLSPDDEDFVVQTATTTDQARPALHSLVHPQTRRLSAESPRPRDPDLSDDYLHGRWEPEASEEHRAKILWWNTLGENGQRDGDTPLSMAHITQMLRPYDSREAWRLAEVLRAYPTEAPQAQALVRGCLRTIAAQSPHGFESLLPAR